MTTTNANAASVASPSSEMASELGKRVAVAAIGIPLAVLVLYIGGWVLAVIIAVIAAMGARELYLMAQAGGVTPLDGVGAPLAGLFVLLAQASAIDRGAASWALVIGATLLVAGLVIWRRGVDGRPLGTSAITIFGALLVGGGLSYAIALRGLGNDPTWVGAGSVIATAKGGAILLAMPIALTWLGDTFAYFGGRTWGRRKLIPAVSPGKTVEGALSSVVGTTVMGAVYAWLILGVWLGVDYSLLLGALAGLLVSITAQIGDLAESLLKREAGVKDSGTLLPGHGGVLDRFDALLFTLPLMYWYLRLTLPSALGA